MATVRKARADEADQVLDFYTRMIDGMRGTEFDVCWEHDVHPTRAFLRASTEAGEVLVVEAPGTGADGPRFAAALVLNAECDPGYDQVRWQVDAAPDEVLVVHVLATLPQFHGRGYARQLLEGAIAAAREAGAKALRLDTFTTNGRAQGLYESCGFANCGVYEDFYPHLGRGGVLYEFAL
ncbi:GNAT family N-acetyltransferase [Gordonibacter sp. RACS_AR68]|uniref:GNAT family N-acetyltransferase n=1 Tax=Gordonibacter sp. RACS_AR68 TaxID=2872005 RepID=UPI00260866DB|nr:GNAT family N-acetyltransferase [Gordonibacter sp. RACS_AR68]MDN4469110.1 GNAT family N-acetyltransferase [Gordonibacter sp. RACS_AR68]